MSMPDAHVFDEYLARSDDELLAELGKELIGSGLGVGSSDPGRARRFTLKWLDEKREELCTRDEVREMAMNPAGERVIEMATLVELLSEDVSQTAAIMAAVLIYRIGLRSFCAGF
ncbi:hypothetical protein [Streptomyces sp. CAI-24]|uniref:hypothetical protein n=1 Tax=Streptomyces sp. CAI-24 TaxID=2712892 RepID=UPI00158659B6|nr:hypothetical protein [Streptomyces sp. CAI-24]NUV40614.1 hypothetical protein [Streptomyces sp. CAI-24]